MVELSLLHAMTGPSDPLPHQQHNNAHSNPTHNPHPNHSPWGTWEELLLGSAVLKHGADNWALVSAELQLRARASFSFTPEACRAGYHAIKLRFGTDGGREGSAAVRYEELRRLRVAHLKRELEQYDNSIGSLVNKIKRLQSEREESRSPIPGPMGAEESPVGSCEPTLKDVADGSTLCGMEKTCSDDISTACVEAPVMEKPCSDIPATCEEAPGDGSVKPKDAHRSSQHRATVIETPVPPLLHASCGEAEATLSKQCNGVKEQVLDESSGSFSHSVMVPVLIPALIDDETKQEEEQPLTSSNTFQLSLSSRDVTSVRSDQGVVVLPSNESSPDPVGFVETEQEMGGRTAEILIRSHDAVDGNRTASATLMEHNNCTVPNEMLNKNRGSCWGEGPVFAERLQSEVSVPLGDTLLGDVSAKQNVSPSLKSVNIEDCKNLARVNVVPCTDDDDGGRQSDESESLCSPRLKSSPRKRRRSYDGSGTKFGREACAQEAVDDKRMVHKALSMNNFSGTVCNLPVESADSTKEKGQKLAAKMSGEDLLVIKVKREMVACKEEDGIVPGSGTAKVEGDLLRKPLNSEVRNQSTSSTENSLLHEVWGESAEVVKEMKPANRQRRFCVHDKKRKATTFNTTGLDGARVGARDLPTRQVESSVKIESMTNSLEASESMHSPVGNEENGTEAWHQVERLSGDSRFEKSEVGSYVDGNEDNSPMSRRNRREPKVSGKLIPLLESLRTVCAHRCAPFFRHRQEQEENEMYYCMVRAPIDLGMIRTKLEEGQYSGSMHFFRDLLLMVSNTAVYYPRDSVESAAASGLRDCVMKEMGNVFETEALVKQEGPSFRKRESRHLAAANQGRRRGGLKLMDKPKPSRELALKQSDVSTSVEFPCLSHQSLAIRLGEGVRADRGVDVKRNSDSPEGKRPSDNQKASEGSNGVKFGSTLLERGNEAKEQDVKIGSTLGKEAAKEPSVMLIGSTTLLRKSNESKDPDSSKSIINVLYEDAKVKDRLSESSGLEKRGEFAKGSSTSKDSALASNKGADSGRKMKAAPDIVVQEPVKRGVGRPPKHSQQHGSQKAREIEVPNSTRKRARR